MNYALLLVRGTVVGSLLGALVLGIGGRAVMRLLALISGRDGVFSFGGSAEVALYGAILGAAGGAAAVLAAPLLRDRPWTGGALLGLALYGATILTLPAHIADTAAPFADMMAAVWLLFGSCFLAWGIAMSRLTASKA